MNEGELNDALQKLIAHDKETISSLYKSVYPTIYKFVVNNNGEAANADDVFQEGMYALFYNAKKEGFKINITIEAYLTAICKNIWFKNLKKRRKSGVTNIGEKELNIGVDGDKALEWAEEQQLMRKKFKLLSPGCQKLLTLFFEGATMEMIAEKMDFSSTKYARKKKYKCKEKLVKLVQNDPIFKELMKNG